MKANFLQFIPGISLFFLSIAGISQSPHQDSIRIFQEHYKKELSSLIKKDTVFIRFYPVSPVFRVIGEVELLPDEPFFKMSTSGKIDKEAIRYAVVTFKIKGRSFKLYAYRLSSLMNSTRYKDDFFIPFTDSTNGLTTYGGGRYLDFVLSDISENHQLVIDFNKAYNPYCAFLSGFNCPIPPRENDLPIEIQAGEMSFGKEKHE